MSRISILAKGSVIYGLGTAINKFLSFLLLPVFTSFLSPGDYGVMAILALLSTLSTGIFTLGTGASMGICYFETSDDDKRSQVIWTSFFLMLVNTLVLYSLISLAAAPLSRLLFSSADQANLIRLSLGAHALVLLAGPFQNFQRLEQRALPFITVSTISAVAGIGMSVYLVAFQERGIAGMLEAGIFRGIVLVAASIIATRRSLKIGFSFSFIKPLVKIGYPSIFGLGAFFLIDWADRVMIQHMASLSELGIYAVAYNIGMFMLLLTEGAFGSAWPPFFMSYLNRREEASVLFGRIFKYYIFGYGLVCLLFFIAAKPVISLMTAPAFHEAYTIIGCVALSYMLKPCYLILLPGIYFEKKLHVQTAIEWVAALINVGLNFLLIPVLMKEGAVIATLASYFSLVVMGHFYGNREMPLRIEWNKIIPFTSGFVIVAGITFYEFTGSIWVDSVIYLALLALLYAVTIRFLLDRAEIERIINLMGFSGSK